MSAILPPAENDTTIQVTLRVPSKLLGSVDEIAKKTGHARATVMIHFLRWATAEWHKEQEPKKPK